MPFWNYLPKTVYQSWVAQKFTDKARGVLDRLANSPATDPLGAAGQGLDDVRRGIDWYTRNVNQPLAGYAREADKALNEPLRGLPGFELGPLKLGGKAAYPEGPQLRGWQSSGAGWRAEKQSGLERFAGEAAADPLNLVGNVGKLATKLPLVGKTVGPAISAVEALPGRAEQQLLAKPLQQGIEAGIGHLPGNLLGPSTRAAAGAASEPVWNAARMAAGPEFAKGEMGTYGAARMLYDPTIAPFLDRTASTSLPGGAKASAKVRDIIQAKDANPQVIAEGLRKMSFEDAVKATRESIKRAREAERTGAGATALREGRFKDFGRGALATAEDIGDTVMRPLQAVNRQAAMFALNTPAYPAGNIGEDLIRSGVEGLQPGFMSNEKFLGEMAGIPGVPSSLVNATHAEQMLGLGPQAPVDTTLQRVGRTVGNFLGGRGMQQLAEAGTAPIRRNAFDQLVKKGLAAGLPPEQASAQALERFKLAFPNYIDETKLDAALKAAIPFWGYGKTKIPYLARAGAEHPAIARMAQRYYEQTEDGNIQVGDSDWRVNPFKGTTLNMVGGIGKPDFPTYAQGPSGKVERGQQLLAKAGLYPGAAAQAGMAAGRFLQGEPVEPGSFVPGPAVVPLQAVEALGAETLPFSGIPGVEPLATAAGNVHDAIAGDRFREYYVNKELAAMGIKPDEATPAQRAEAEQRTALRMGATTELGFASWKPEAERDYRDEQLQAAIRAGVPEDVARRANQSGNPLSAADEAGQSYLTAAQKRAVYEGNPQWEPWRQVSEPLKRPGERASLQETRDYFRRLDEIDNETTAALEQIHARYEQGAVSGTMFREQRGDLLSRASAKREEAKAAFAKRGALVDEAARDKFYASSNRVQPGDRPQDRAARAYYDIQPQPDPRTGEIDFDGFYTARQQVLDRMDPATREYVLKEYPRQKYKDNPTVAAGEASYQTEMEAFRAYLNTPKYLGFSVEDAKQIDEASRVISLLREQYPGMSDAFYRAMVPEELQAAAWMEPFARRLKNPERTAMITSRPGLRRLLADVTGETFDDVTGGQPAPPPRMRFPR